MSDPTPNVERLRAEYCTGRALGIGEPAPRLSWITTTSAPGWMQAAYEIEVDGDALGRIESDASLFVPWPADPITSRSRHVVRVRVWGADGSASEWSAALEVEAGLLDDPEWSAEWITSPDVEDLRPQRFRRSFETRSAVASARLHVTSAGVHTVELNGAPIGDHVLAPGWTAYPTRLRYDTHDVTDLIAAGDNVVGLTVADGWYRGHLGWEMERNVYGDRIGPLAQLEITYVDGTIATIATDDAWVTAPGPWEAADLYNGETYDARRAEADWCTPGFDASSWTAAEVFDPAVGDLVAPIGPPVRRIEELPVVEVLTTPSGRTVLDFGQNLVGWVRLTVDGDAGHTITLRHAEVMEHGELGTRPLRNAEATDRYVLRGDGPETWEPTFTFHGFRYAEIDGWPGELDPSSFTAVVLHSDFERTGTFSCSHELLDRFHRNVVWGMRGNFLDVPTDCPQRDERLGWTGDLQVFLPTASFLYQVDGFVADWLEDLTANQGQDGNIPHVVPGELFGDPEGGMVTAAWGDAATVVPWVQYQRYGDRDRLERQYDSMRAWVDLLRRRAGDVLLWPQSDFQLGDWLDPAAPPDQPWAGTTDMLLVATAYFAQSARILGDTAAVLGRTAEADEYHELAAGVRAAFRHHYVTPSGRTSSDSVTAYALALAFDLYETDEQRAEGASRLEVLCRVAEYRIATGFVGTPIVLPALTGADDLTTAYRLLTETECPSWLYPVTMGATTVWERWDAMLPDGTINPGEMTSFNHYALGGVADWMHQTIGGIAPAAPGYRELRIAPVPGPGVTWAECALNSPYGRVACRWRVEGTTVSVRAELPPNTSGTVVLPGSDEGPIDVVAGSHEWAYTVTDDVARTWVSD